MVIEAASANCTEPLSGRTEADDDCIPCFLLLPFVQSPLTIELVLSQATGPEAAEREYYHSTS